MISGGPLFLTIWRTTWPEQSTGTEMIRKHYLEKNTLQPTLCALVLNLNFMGHKKLRQNDYTEAHSRWEIE